jgi:hypothetical protein
LRQIKGVTTRADVDLSATNVANIEQQFSDYRFVVEVRTDSSALLMGEFYLVTLFTVLHHIVEDTKRAETIAFAHRHLGADGTLLIFDQLLESDYRLGTHVKYWVGRLAYQFAAALFRRGTRIPNQMLLVVRRAQASMNALLSQTLTAYDTGYIV